MLPKGVTIISRDSFIVARPGDAVLNDDLGAPRHA